MATPSLTIREIRVRALSLVPARPMETAGGTLSSTPLVLVDLLTEEGIAGTSYLRCYSPEALAPLATLVANLNPLLKGDRAAPLPVEAKLSRHFRLLGQQGLTGIALAGIDMALWDALAKANNLPLATLLGGTPQPIPAYASLRTMNPSGAAAEAEELLTQGFDAIKVKVGRGSLADDLATIRAVRSAIGDNTKLMVDYNQSLSVAEAIRRAHALDAENLYWIEEPTRADDYDGHARIARETRTALQLGENCWGPHDVAKLIAANASDHLMLDVMKGGGVSGWLRSAAVAEPSGLPISSHAFPEYSAHLLAVTPTCHYLEYLDHVGPILAEPVHIKNGHALIPDRPGAGLEWDEAAVSRALVS